MKRMERLGCLLGTDLESLQSGYMLVSEGRVAVREVHSVLKRREKLLRELRARLAALGAEGFKVLDSVRRVAWGARKAGPKKRRVSAATRAAWAAQGAYMAAVRRLPKAARGKIRAIRERSGVAAAILQAKKISRRS